MIIIAGWLGIPMLFIFCSSVGYAATRLGKSWIILEKRWPEKYRPPVRQPYMDIAERAFGKIGRCRWEFVWYLGCVKHLCEVWSNSVGCWELA